MPENRKYYPHNSVVLVTSRTEEGLPLVPTHFMNFIIWGILGRGKSLYRVKVCHFCFMANHFHMLLVVDDPQHVSEFVGYVKGEISHAVNRLLGRRKKTIWTEGYDSPILLTSNDVLRYIGYIYLNPARANLVESIETYPGISSWDMFKSGSYSKMCKKLHRNSIKKLSLPALSINEQKVLTKVFEIQSLPEFEFMLEPFAWMECFEEYKWRKPEELKEQLINAIHKEEQKLDIRRKAEHRQVIGATELRRQSMLKEYTPMEFSKKMICLCSDIDLRKIFINHFRTLCDKARKVYQAWKLGNFSQRIPPGFFAPRVPTLVSQLSVWA